MNTKARRSAIRESGEAHGVPVPLNGSRVFTGTGRGVADKSAGRSPEHAGKVPSSRPFTIADALIGRLMR